MFRTTLALVATLVAVPSTALAADDLGPSGRIADLQVNYQSADAYLQFHGRVFIETGKNNFAEYRWGGTSCGSKVLSENMVMMLMHVLDTGLTVEPIFQTGQGTAKCLVAFNVLP